MTDLTPAEREIVERFEQAPDALAEVAVAQPSPALALAQAIDPEAFEDHPIERRRHVAALQWAVRRRLAYEHAGRVLASDWLARMVAEARTAGAAEVRERVEAVVDEWDGKHVRDGIDTATEVELACRDQLLARLDESPLWRGRLEHIRTAVHRAALVNFPHPEETP